ncbi:MAG TPA: hypothetical protein VHF69_01400, partial [Candidatus Synoicihabitans sp.]|nr:hypothetical protein [Candidatus Synoicihabitans sp.]
ATLLRQGPLSVREAALAAVRRLEVREAASELHALVAEPKAPAVLQAQALDVLDAFDDPQLLATVQLAGNSTIPQVRLAALPILARVAPREALPVIRRLIEGADREQRAAFLALSKLDLPETSEMLAHALQRLAEGKVAAAAQFDLLEVAEKSTAPQVQALLARQKETWATGTDPLAPFRGALTGGDHRKGADVFYDHPVMACVRCHKVSGSGGDAGPDLTTIATHRTPEHLLESIIKPSAEIAPGFDVVSVTLRNGQLESGTVLHETPEALTLRRPDDTEVVLTKADISGREAAPSSMPEIYAQVLTRAELRDLMTFLRRLNTTVAPPVNDGPRALRSGRPRGARGDEAVVLEEAAENEG